MNFHFLRAADLPACAALVNGSRPGFDARDDVKNAMPLIWRDLLARDEARGGVVIDRAADGSEAIAAFGLSVFVDDAFADEVVANRPHSCSPVALVYERILAGRSPVLSPAAVARANAGDGLTLLVLHFVARSLSMPPTPAEIAVVTVGHTMFRLAHEGYNVSRMLHEAYGPTQRAFLEAGGLRFLSGAPDEPLLLMGATRADADVHLPGAAVSFLFMRRTPALGFTPAEQRVLLRAVHDATDDAIADDLGISYDAVKKSWRRIYERVAVGQPGLLEGNDDAADDTLRGKEKRRRLLQYLRNNLHELRPFKT